ncbi:unnamed protein product [Owenia fusiformis]|uniref:ARID domain-containing protein n=1 Tax=Owenia fusiformis TaxID=6347 RepID=A0A8S4PHW0_OWEFU|nr:unnamed protein product [Owenia fusiformis]
MAGEEPPYLNVGVEVSAKYKGAFCEAKIKKVVRQVKCKVVLKEGNMSVMVTDEHIKGPLRLGAVVEVKNPTTGQTVEATIASVKDSSMYTAIFDDGDEATLRRTQLCLKGEKHFIESETLDQLPLTHPEHFGTPVVQSRKKALYPEAGMSKRRSGAALSNDEFSSSDEDDDTPKKRVYKGRLVDMIGKVVNVESTDKRKGSTWVPMLVVLPSASDIELKTKEHLLVRSFKDNKYQAVPRKDTKEFTKEVAMKNDDKSLKVTMERSLRYIEEEELPSNWNKNELLGSDSEIDSESPESSDEESHQERDRFVAQLYKFMDDRCTPINKTPQIGNQDLNLYKLFRLVREIGGFNKVTNQMKWRHVYNRMGLPITGTASHQIKSAYKKYLHAFEDFYRKLGNAMGTLSGRPSRPSRQQGPSTGRSILSFRERESPKSPRKADIMKKEKDEAQNVKDDDNESVRSEDSRPDVSSRDSPRRGRPKAHLTPTRESTPTRKDPLEKKQVEDKKDKGKEDNKRTSKPTEKKLEMLKKEEEKRQKEEKTKEKNTPPPKLEMTKKMTRSTSVLDTQDTKEKPPEIKEKEKPKEENPSVEKRGRRSMRGGDKPSEEEATSREDNTATPPPPVLESPKQQPSVTRRRSMRGGDKPDEEEHSDNVTTSKKEDPKETRKREEVKKKEESKKKEEPKKTVESDDESDAGSERTQPEHDRTSEKEFRLSKDDGDYPIGTKLKVKYGRGKSQKIYEAKICESEIQNNARQYLVHYAGWNTRYDEWVRKDRIVSYVPSPAQKSSPRPMKPGSESPRTQNPKTTPQPPMKSPDSQPKKRGRPFTAEKPSPDVKKTAPEVPQVKKPAQDLSRRPRSKSPASSSVPAKPRSTRSHSAELSFAAGLPSKPKRTRKNSGYTDNSEQVSVSEETDSESDISVDEKKEPEPMETDQPPEPKKEPLPVEPPKPSKAKTTEQKDNVKTRDEKPTKSDKLKEVKTEVKALEQKETSQKDKESVEVKASEELEEKIVDDDMKTEEKEFTPSEKEQKEEKEAKTVATKEVKTKPIVKETKPVNKEPKVEIKPQTTEDITTMKSEKVEENIETEVKPEPKQAKKTPKGKLAEKKETAKREPSERKRQISESKVPKEEPQPPKLEEEAPVEKEYSHDDPLLDIATRGVEKEMQEEESKKTKEDAKKKKTKAVLLDRKATIVLERKLKQKESPEKSKEDKDGEKKKVQKKVKKKKKTAEDTTAKVSGETLNEDGEKDPYDFGDSESVEEPIKLEHVERRDPVKFDRQYDSLKIETVENQEINPPTIPKVDAVVNDSKPESLKSPQAGPSKSKPLHAQDDYVARIDTLLSATCMENTPPTTPDTSPRRQEPSSDMSPLPEESYSTTRSEHEANIEVEHFMHDRRSHPAGDESPNGCNASTISNSSGGSSGNAPSSESSIEPTSKRKIVESPDEQIAGKRRKRGHKRGSSNKTHKTKENKGSDSDEASTADPSLANSTASLSTSPLKKPTYEPRPRSPSSYKYNFHLEEGAHLVGEERIAFIQAKMQEIRKIYGELKQDLASMDRKRKRARRREREAAAAAAAACLSTQGAGGEAEKA